MMTNDRDPWSELPLNGPAGVRTERRADPTHPLDFYRARDFDGKYLFVLKCGNLPVIPRLPVLSGLSTFIQRYVDRPDELIIELKENIQISVFRGLCADILESTRGIDIGDNSKGAVEVIKRLERWVELFSRRRDSILSKEAMLGLMGELYFLRDFVLKKMDPLDAIRTWRGPFGEEQDFAISDWVIEVKAQLVTADQYLNISSEAQLDSNGARIAVFHISLTPVGLSENRARTLNELVAEVRHELFNDSPAALDLYEYALLSVGYEPRSEYGTDSWLISSSRAYEVGEGFPRLVPTNINQGIKKVSYSILLGACAHWVRDENWMMSEVFQ